MKRLAKRPTVKRMSLGGMIGLAGGALPMVAADEMKSSYAPPDLSETEEEKKKRKQREMLSSSPPTAMKKGGVVRGCGAAMRGKTKGAMR